MKAWTKKSILGMGLGENLRILDQNPSLGPWPKFTGSYKEKEWRGLSILRRRHIKINRDKWTRDGTKTRTYDSQSVLERARQRQEIHTATFRHSHTHRHTHSDRHTLTHSGIKITTFFQAT